MKLKEQYKIVKEKIKEDEKELFKKFHYSKTHRCPVKYTYKLIEGDKTIGLALFGNVTGQRAAVIYKNALELKKLVIIDDTPKNTESFFIGACLRDIKKTNDYNGILSYADPSKKHRGTIYKASNFKYIGRGKTNTFFVKKNKIVSGRQVWQKKDGKYCKSALKYQEEKKLGILKPKKVKGKHIFYYTFGE